jgi:ligand-binding sensor domain-containing protein
VRECFTTYTVAQGLASNKVLSIAEDKAGYVWFGTDGGLSRYDPREDVGAGASTGSKCFTTYTTKEGLANNAVFSIAGDKTGNLWFGTGGGGVSRYDGTSFTTYSTAQGLANNTVYAIADDKTGSLWFGTGDGGVSRYDGKAFTTYSTAQGLLIIQYGALTKTKPENYGSVAEAVE